jgi:DNA-binding response OmpR family regulator
MRMEELSLSGDGAHGESSCAPDQSTLSVASDDCPPEARSVLLVSPLPEDHEFLGQLFSQQNWKLYGVRTLGCAIALLRDQPIPVVVTERDLPLGGWKDLLAATQLLTHRPLLVVAARLADEYLWTEVLNLGGHDVLAKPFQAKELRWVLESAWRATAAREGRPMTAMSGAAGIS